MFKENVEVLRQHYSTLTRDDKEALPLELTGIPRLNGDSREVDVGQDLFKLNRKF